MAVRSARSGADLVGYLNYIHPYRLQVLGEREIAYLCKSTSIDCQRRVARIVMLQPPVLLRRMARLLVLTRQWQEVRWPVVVS